MRLKKMKKPRSVRPWYGHARTGSKTWLKKNDPCLPDSDMVIGGLNKYYYVFEWKSRFTSGLNAAKSIHCIEKYVKQKLYKMKLLTKNSLGACLHLPNSGGRGSKHLSHTCERELKLSIHLAWMKRANEYKKRFPRYRSPDCRVFGDARAWLQETRCSKDG